jgi:uncharacterized cupredoxin-like copper-binding protein
MSLGTRRLGLALAAMLFGMSAVAHAAAQSPTVVHVDLMDPSTGPSIKSMVIKADRQSSKPGPVVFAVSNHSKNLAHEMIVVSVAGPDATLPYDQKDDRVIESKIQDLGEASDLQPGEKKTLRLILKPGNYILMCNQPDHFKAGMRTSLVVER